MVDEINKARAEDAGCWIAGWWGQYAVARMVVLAGELGFAEEDEKLVALAQRHLQTGAFRSTLPSAQDTCKHGRRNLNCFDCYPASGEQVPGLSEDEWETLHGSADGVELWLNREVAPAGFAFHWTDGEFFLSSIEDLEDSDVD